MSQYKRRVKVNSEILLNLDSIKFKAIHEIMAEKGSKAFVKRYGVTFTHITIKFIFDRLVIRYCHFGDK